MKMKFLSVMATGALVCTLAPAALAQNVAIVNGKPVPTSRVDALSQQIARSGRPVTPEMQAQIKEEVIAREVFIQEAQKLGYENTDDFKTQLELAHQALLIRRFGNFQKSNVISDAEIKAEYNRLTASNGGKEYRARRILVEKEDEAKAIIAQLNKGAKFDIICKKSSKDPGSGARGGDLDWASAGNYVAEFAQALTKLSKGKIDKPPLKHSLATTLFALTMSAKHRIAHVRRGQASDHATVAAAEDCKIPARAAVPKPRSNSFGFSKKNAACATFCLLKAIDARHPIFTGCRALRTVSFFKRAHFRWAPRPTTSFARSCLESDRVIKIHPLQVRQCLF